MLITYTNDAGMTMITEVSSIHDIIPDLNGGESISEQLEVFTVGFKCNAMELVAATNWANECTSHNMVGIAAGSNKIFNETYNIVVFDGVGGVNEYNRMVNNEPIFDYYPAKNLRECMEYYNYKTQARKLIAKVK